MARKKKRALPLSEQSADVQRDCEALRKILEAEFEYNDDESVWQHVCRSAERIGKKPEDVIKLFLEKKKQ